MGGAGGGDAVQQPTARGEGHGQAASAPQQRQYTERRRARVLLDGSRCAPAWQGSTPNPPTHLRRRSSQQHPKSLAAWWRWRARLVRCRQDAGAAGPPTQPQPGKSARQPRGAHATKVKGDGGGRGGGHSLAVAGKADVVVIPGPPAAQHAQQGKGLSCARQPLGTQAARLASRGGAASLPCQHSAAHGLKNVQPSSKCNGRPRALDMRARGRLPRRGPPSLTTHYCIPLALQVEQHASGSSTPPYPEPLPPDENLQ